jgi:hypothetical protein
MGQFSVKILAPEGQFSVAINSFTLFSVRIAVLFQISPRRRAEQAFEHGGESGWVVITQGKRNSGY